MIHIYGVFASQSVIYRNNWNYGTLAAVDIVGGVKGWADVPYLYIHESK